MIDEKELVNQLENMLYKNNLTLCEVVGFKLALKIVKEMPKLEPVDYLAMMLEIQDTFQKKTGFEPRIANLASCIMAEGGELWMGAGGKWWKTYIEGAGRWGSMTPTDAIKYMMDVEKHNIDNIREETIDILHFWLCILLSLGMTSKDTYEEYCKKMGVNVNRQKTGY